MATRYDKRERIYQGTIDVASISIWLRDPVPLSRPGARCWPCDQSVSPTRPPNPPCASQRNGLSTVAAVGLVQPAQGLGILVPR